MKVNTNLGMLDIKPADVVSIRPAPVMPDAVEFSDLTHCVEFDDRFYSMGDDLVCISEADAEKLSELAGVEIEGRTEKKKPEEPPEPTKKSTGGTIFFPFAKQLILNEWEKVFDRGDVWRPSKEWVSEKKPEPEQNPAPSSNTSSHENRTLYEEYYQPKSPIEQILQEQNNCTECGKLVYDESRICSGCIDRREI